MNRADGPQRDDKRLVDPKKQVRVQQRDQFVKAVFDDDVLAFGGDEPGSFVLEKEIGHLRRFDAANLDADDHHEPVFISYWGQFEQHTHIRRGQGGRLPNPLEFIQGRSKFVGTDGLKQVIDAIGFERLDHILGVFAVSYKIRHLIILANCRRYRPA